MWWVRGRKHGMGGQCGGGEGEGQRRGGGGDAYKRSRIICKEIILEQIYESQDIHLNNNICLW